MLLATLMAAIALGGCGDEDEAPEPGAGEGSDGLSIELEPTKAAPGETIAARVVNESTDPFTYGAGYALEREVGGAFEQVSEPDRAVIQIAYEAGAGETGPPVRVEVPKGAKPGSWRVVLGTPAPDGDELTAEFEVVRDG
ncbi:MAG: immunoglobulin-like domain-containing protein [Solirubrobacterales bacterium]